jgi:NAD(P)-dependent dehydrogenase (short-subunit alcohol dehydrogenase family)
MKKTVIITGASGNLGRATVQRFAKDGYRVIATIPPGEVPATSTPGDIEVHHVDLLDENSAGAFVERIINKHKSIEAALLLVGGYASGDIAEATGAQLRSMVSLNFESAYYCARPIFLQMRSQQHGGRIVLVGARPALEPKKGKGSLAYTISKSMLFKLAEVLNADAKGKNIVTSVIVPSTLDTPANRAAMPDADFSAWVKPEKLADILAFMVSPQAEEIVEGVVKVYGTKL